MLKPEVSKGGIVLATKDDQRTTCVGRVLEIGPKVEQIKAGDWVIFHESANLSFEFGLLRCIVLQEDEVFGICTKDDMKLWEVELEGVTAPASA